MKKNVFIGIDFSKKKFDVSVIHRSYLNKIDYQEFENTKEGCQNLIQWIKTLGYRYGAEWLFCAEHTGLYGVLLSEFLIKKKYFLWMENPMQIKQSTGIKRDKNDKIDSRDIALYAYRFQDKAVNHQLPDKDLKALEMLLAHRERLLKNKHTLMVSSSEMRAVLNRNATARYIYELSLKEVERINKEVKTIEKRMRKIIEENDSFRENYELGSSIKGVALINTATILVATQNFTRFQNSRQFACFCGMAPFGKQSGTSLKTQPRISHLADKKIKALLTQAAKCAIRHDTNVRLYYQRKLNAGKKERVIINNVRNKLIHRIFALVRNRQLYQLDYRIKVDSTAA